MHDLRRQASTVTVMWAQPRVASAAASSLLLAKRGVWIRNTTPWSAAAARSEGVGASPVAAQAWTATPPPVRRILLTTQEAYSAVPGPLQSVPQLAPTVVTGLLTHELRAQPV